MAQPDRINTCGNSVHFTGFGSLRGWMASADALNETCDVPSVSGAAFAVRRSLYNTLGGFDESFFPAYVEETDLCWRAQLAGYTCRYVPDSIIYHDYKLDFRPDKYFWLERNRCQMLLKNLRWPTLLLLIPALLLADGELGVRVLNGMKHIRQTAQLRLDHHTLAADRRARRGVRQIRQVAIVIFYELLARLAFGQAGSGATAKNNGFDPLFFFSICT
jgi:GT2 family glycosyltransferase